MSVCMCGQGQGGSWFQLATPGGLGPETGARDGVDERWRRKDGRLKWGLCSVRARRAILARGRRQVCLLSSHPLYLTLGVTRSQALSPSAERRSGAAVRVNPWLLLYLLAASRRQRGTLETEGTFPFASLLITDTSSASPSPHLITVPSGMLGREGAHTRL